MATFTSIQKGIEVNGACIMSIIKGMGVFKDQAIKILESSGLDHIEDSTESWYSQQKWLDAFKVISEKTGKNTLFEIGKQIPDSAEFPPSIKTVKDALRSIDVAYHMNHRNSHGKVLFDPTSGAMFEGIGHYHFEDDTTNEKKAYIICDNPYPDDFDKGIITAMVRLFTDGYVNVKAVDEKNTRKNGSNSTKFSVSWN